MRLCSCAASGAEAEELEPVFANFVATGASDVRHEGFEFVPREVFDATTVFAEEEVVMAGSLGNKRLTTVGVVDTLDGPQFFKFFEGAVDGDKAETGAIHPREVIHIRGTEGPGAGGDGFNDRAPRGCEAIAISLKEGEPGLDAVCRLWGGRCFHCQLRLPYV